MTETPQANPPQQRGLAYRAYRKARRIAARFAPVGSPQRAPYTIVRKVVHFQRLHGWRALFARALKFKEAPRVLTNMSHAEFLQLSLDDQYQVWLRKHEITKDRARSMRKKARALPYQPLITVAIPASDADHDRLRESIESVRGQVYENWELALVAHGSQRDLKKAAGRDSRIRVVRSPGDGEAAACNAALSEARGEFFCLLHAGDELRATAFSGVVRALNRDRKLDFFYTDEDRLAEDGRRVQPFFKPDWAPDTLLALDYATHLGMFRTELARSVGGFREEAGASHELDLVLRVTENTDRIGHVSTPAYSRRLPDEHGSESDTRVISEHLARRGLKASVSNGVRPGYHTVRYELRERPHVAIIIPTRDRVDMLRRCIELVREKSTYDDYEIIIINNQSAEPETLEYFKSFDGRVIDYPHEFNYSAQMNLGVEQAGCEYVIFLNNDTELLTPDWIEAMLEHAQRPEVGAVGARLWFPGGKVQHEGVIVGPRDLARNLDMLGYYSLGDCIRNATAVTAACMLTKTSVYRAVGGFDTELAVAYNDVDFCIRLREKGYLVIYTPHAELTHQEGGTRGNREPRQNAELFAKRYRGFRDPYYNDNFDMEYLYYIKY